MFETVNPATEKMICSVHEATAADVDIAVAAARKAFEGGWMTETGFNRGRLMAKLADLVERDLEILSQLESIDNRKAINIARTVDGPMSADCIRYYGGRIDKIHGNFIDPDPDHLVYTRMELRAQFSTLHHLAVTTSIDGRLRPNHSLEFPIADVGLEDWPRYCHGKLRCDQISRANSIVSVVHGQVD